MADSRYVLDRADPTPLYQQLAEVVRAEIDEGAYQIGALLPSESELGARWDVSRSVVRQTLNSLARQGVIRTEKGKGSFVAEPKLNQHFVQRTTGFFDDLTRMGYRIDTRIVRQEVVDVDGEIADFLATRRAVELDRVRSVDGRVLTFNRTYLVESLCPGLVSADLGDRSLYDYLHDEYGLSINQGVRTVEAVPADGEIARHLEVPPGTPVLLLRSAGRTRDGRPLEWFDAWHRADRTRFEVTITPDIPEAHLEHRTVLPDNDLYQPPRGGGHSGVRTPFRSTELAVAISRNPVVISMPTPRPEEAERIVTALRAGGVHAIEFPANDDDGVRALAAASRTPGVLVGACAVGDVETGRRAVVAGAAFLSSRVVLPMLASEIGEVPVLLGGSSPTELRESWRFSESPIVWYPTGSASQLRSLTASLPAVDVIPCVGLDDVPGDNFRAGAYAVVVEVTDQADLDRLDELTERVRRIAADAASFRKEING